MVRWTVKFDVYSIVRTDNIAKVVSKGVGTKLYVITSHVSDSTSLQPFINYTLKHRHSLKSL